MVPDVGAEFLTGGRGSGVGRAVGRWGAGYGFVYVPEARDITVDVTRVGATVALRWFDPTTGEVIEIASAEPARAARVVAHPGRNAAGDDDWVLLIEATG
jgi:hypothetical protein